MCLLKQNQNGRDNDLSKYLILEYFYVVICDGSPILIRNQKKVEFKYYSWHWRGPQSRISSCQRMHG